MSEEALAALHAEIEALDVRDRRAVREVAAKIEALGDAARTNELCARSNTLRRAVGELRAEALAELLARDAHEAFIHKCADESFMATVDVAEIRIPRYVAVSSQPCACGTALMVPYAKQGGPGFGFECPSCSAPYVARPTYAGGEYRVVLENDTRPAKKRKKRNSIP